MPGFQAQGICLPPYFLMDDRVRLLTAHELKAFLAFALLAARSRREPGVIPAMPPEMRAKKLGMPLKTCEKRLERLSAPGIELIEARADGALVMADLWDEDDEWDGGQGDRGPVARSAGAERVARYRDRRNGNGTGSNGHGNAEALQIKGEALQNGSQALQNGSKGVTPGVTGAGPQSPQNGHAEALQQPLHPRVRVGDVSNVSGISNKSLDSRDVLNVADDRPVTPDVTLPGSPPPPRPPLASQGIPSGVPSGVPSRPVSRPALRVVEPGQVPAARREDVRLVMQFVGDPPDFRGMWHRVWNHCHQHDLLHCWDEGVAILVERLRTSPPSGRGAVRGKGKLLKVIILALLARAGHTYLPAAAGDQAEGEPEPPVDEAEAADVRRQIEEIRARWQAEEETAEAGQEGEGE